jgi:tRNA threonylcarbamoyladenosine biosynthesis protein TsaB
LIAVDTLKILAAQAPVSDGLIIPMIDARRMEVYSAIFTSELESKRELGLKL